MSTTRSFDQLHYLLANDDFIFISGRQVVIFVLQHLSFFKRHSCRIEKLFPTIWKTLYGQPTATPARRRTLTRNDLKILFSGDSGSRDPLLIALLGVAQSYSLISCHDNLIVTNFRAATIANTSYHSNRLLQVASWAKRKTERRPFADNLQFSNLSSCETLFRSELR